MHALPGQDVKRTFSGVLGISAGLPGQSTLEAESQEFTQLLQPLVGRWIAHNRFFFEPVGPEGGVRKFSCS
jgi:hypothetical protein